MRGFSAATLLLLCAVVVTCVQHEHMHDSEVRSLEKEGSELKEDAKRLPDGARSVRKLPVESKALYGGGRLESDSQEILRCGTPLSSGLQTRLQAF